MQYGQLGNSLCIYVAIRSYIYCLFIVVGCTIPCMDAVFVLDVSVSIQNEENFQLMKDLVRSTFDMADISENCSRAAVMLFARQAWISFTLNDHLDKNSLQNALDQIRYDEISRYNHTGTNTPAALNLMLTAAQDGTLGLRNDMVHIAMFITDGRPNIKHLGIPNNMAIEATETAANELHGSEIYDQIYAIGIEGTKPIGRTLNYIAEPSSLVFPISGFNAALFEELGRNITLEFCNRKCHY